MYLSLNAQMLALPRKIMKMAPPGCDVDVAQEIMDDHDFNVVPVAADHPEGSIVQYWYRQEQTDFPECFRVLAEDMLPGQTPIEGALDFILRSEKPFVFIRDRLRVTGLLNLSDFNGNPFRVYVFSQVVMLETLLSRFVEQELGSEVVEGQIGEKGMDQLRSDKKQGLNYSPCHYLYLRTCCNCAQNIGYMRFWV